MRLRQDEEACSDARAASQRLAQEAIVQQEEVGWEQSCAHAQHGCARRQDLAAQWRMTDTPPVYQKSTLTTQEREVLDPFIHFSQFAQSLSLYTLVPVVADVCDVEARLIADGMSPEDAHKKCLDPYFIRKRPDVRRRKLAKKECLNRIIDHSQRVCGKKIPK